MFLGRIKLKHMRNPAGFVSLALLFLLAVSCRTLPEISGPFSAGETAIPLEPGAIAYILADVKNARPILNFLPIRELNENQAGQILDRTQSAVVAVYPRESGRRFQLAAWGDFPTGQAGIALGLSKEWKKARSQAGYSYWYSQAGGLSLAINAKQAHVAAVSAGVPPDPISHSPPVQFPADFIAASAGSIISCWLENPGTTVNRLFEAMGLPLQLPAERMYITIFPNENPAQDSGLRYRAAIKIEASGESQAKALETLFSMARVFSSQAPETNGVVSLAAVLFANAPVRDGKYLELQTAPLTEKDIALLFSFFSIY
ncbi:MAG TPA: hypothetical protein DEQ14_05515 [Treponema sp.]|nr:hypothetical protein [Treponema sp.]